MHNCSSLAQYDPLNLRLHSSYIFRAAIKVNMVQLQKQDNKPVSAPDLSVGVRVKLLTSTLLRTLLRVIIELHSLVDRQVTEGKGEKRKWREM